MKKYGGPGQMDCGFIHVGNRSRIYLHPAHGARLPVGAKWDAVLKGIPHKQYDGVTAMLDEGWTVD